jgi:hypothetical protein
MSLLESDELTLNINIKSELKCNLQLVQWYAMVEQKLLPLHSSHNHIADCSSPSSIPSSK